MNSRSFGRRIFYGDTPWKNLTTKQKVLHVICVYLLLTIFLYESPEVALLIVLVILGRRYFKIKRELSNE